MDERIIYHEIGKDPLYKTWHASKEHLLMYIYSDGGSIVCAEKVFPIKRGTLVFIAAGAYHYTMPDNPKIYDRSKLMISPSKFDKILEILKEGGIFGTLFEKALVYAEIEEEDQSTVDRIFGEINGYEGEAQKVPIVLSCLLRLLIFLNKYATESTSTATGLMGKAIKYINENISSELDIEGICSAINISKYYFCRQFKEHTGMTVMNYILKTRLLFARMELQKSNLTIMEISEKCGFSSVSYFCRVFKEAENCTPLQYRKSFGK